MLTFTLAISCLTTSNLPWFMDLTFQVYMQYCSLQHRTLLLSPVISTDRYSFCFGSIPSFFLELFLHWSCSVLLKFGLIKKKKKIQPFPTGEAMRSPCFLPLCTWALEYSSLRSTHGIGVDVLSPGADLLPSAHRETRQQNKMRPFFRQGDTKVVLNVAKPDVSSSFFPTNQWGEWLPPGRLK